MIPGRINKYSKRALSEVVSYVLLIVIALAIAAMVAGWLRIKADISQRETCPADASLVVKTYSCDKIAGEISITIQNNGLFDIAGFFIRASNEIGKLPTILLKSTDAGQITEGRYNFSPDVLSPRQEKQTKFSYSDAATIEVIQLQPFVIDSEDTIQLCERMITMNLEGDCILDTG